MEVVKQSVTESNTSLVEATQRSSEFETQLLNRTEELNAAVEKVSSWSLVFTHCVTVVLHRWMLWRRSWNRGPRHLMLRSMSVWKRVRTTPETGTCSCALIFSFTVPSILNFHLCSCDLVQSILCSVWHHNTTAQDATRRATDREDTERSCRIRVQQSEERPTLWFLLTSLFSSLFLFVLYSF